MIFIEFASTGNARDKQHLAGVDLARSMLEKYTDTNDSSISRENTGKPYFDTFANADFSVSHSGEAVLCALSCPTCQSTRDALPFPEDKCLSADRCYYIETSVNSSKVGADIECISSDMSDDRLIALAERYFHPEEIKYIKNDGFSREKFYSVWTKKESFGKMLGTGLKGILSGFDVTSETAAVLKDFILECNGVKYVGAVCFKP